MSVDDTSALQYKKTSSIDDTATEVPLTMMAEESDDDCCCKGREAENEAKSKKTAAFTKVACILVRKSIV